jgi:2,4-didehydro-3-deoxy-L-rhamnonate hydrolase
MACTVIRYKHPQNAFPDAPRWGVVFQQRIAPLSTQFATTREFLEGGVHLAKAARPSDATVALAEVEVCSPVTCNQQFLCQGINYASHVRESGMDPDRIAFNTFFTKASSCIVGAQHDVVKPKHVNLLDYEVELGLVLGRDITGPVNVKPDALGDYLAGVTIVNDVSARDIQLPQGQFYKGKSYRTFGPVGPYLLLLDPHEWALWPQLQMRLSVNGQIRQDAPCGDMIHPPHVTLTELSQLQDMHAGDLIATGTPAGCAAKAPGKAAMLAAKMLLSDETKWKIFVRGGQKNPRYLQPGDVMNLSIRTPDGVLDLGEQKSRVAAE